MAHFNATEEEKAYLLQHGNKGKVLEMILLVKQLAEREKVTTAEVIVQVEDAQGQHLGHYCARGGTPQCRAALMRCLLEFTSAQKGLRKLFLDARDRAGNTPLMVGARQGHARMLAMLASHGVLVTTKNNAKETILHQAVHAHSVDTLEAALRRGADINAGDAQNRTPLHWAAIYNDLLACKRLIRQGASLAIQETHGHTVLHVAARFGHLEVASAVLAAGGMADAQSKGGATALHLAADWGHPTVVSLLVDNGADVNAQDSACITPLHAAVLSKRDGTFDCIKTLLASSHIKPELKNSMWKTAEELAHGQEDVLALFKRM